MANLADGAEGAVGLDQGANQLGNTSLPARSAMGFKAREIGSERGVHEGVPGRVASKSAKPCSISFN
jgi:hypothetical protein